MGIRPKYENSKKIKWGGAAKQLRPRVTIINWNQARLELKKKTMKRNGEKPQKASKWERERVWEQGAEDEKKNSNKNQIMFVNKEVHMNSIHCELAIVMRSLSICMHARNMCMQRSFPFEMSFFPLAMQCAQCTHSMRTHNVIYCLKNRTKHFQLSHICLLNSSDCVCRVPCSMCNVHMKYMHAHFSRCMSAHKWTFATPSKR